MNPKMAESTPAISGIIPCSLIIIKTSLQNALLDTITLTPLTSAKKIKIRRTKKLQLPYNKLGNFSQLI